MLYHGEISVDAENSDHVAGRIFQRQFSGVIPGDPPARIDQPFHFANQRLSRFHYAFFVCGRLTGSLLRPKIKIAFADQVRRAGYAHEFGHRSTRANESAVGVFEINLVYGVLEKEIKKLLF